jgi:hypothetical protein
VVEREVLHMHVDRVENNKLFVVVTDDLYKSLH